MPTTTVETFRNNFIQQFRDDYEGEGEEPLFVFSGKPGLIDSMRASSRLPQSLEDFHQSDQVMPAFLNTNIKPETTTTTTTTTTSTTTTPKNFLLKRRERLRIRQRARGRRPTSGRARKDQSRGGRGQPSLPTVETPSLALRLEPVQQSSSSRSQTSLNLQVRMEAGGRGHVLQDISVFSKSKDDGLANLLAIAGDNKVAVLMKGG